jgi:hypothetical protein
MPWAWITSGRKSSSSRANFSPASREWKKRGSDARLATPPRGANGAGK